MKIEKYGIFVDFGVLIKHIQGMEHKMFRRTIYKPIFPPSYGMRKWDILLQDNKEHE